MPNPLVSIITPCYNSETTISQTIESVILQTFEDWEMLIVDDCSTDNSAEIIKIYVKKDNRIKYFRTNKNLGNPSEPRNLALEKAKGKYVAMLDSDDSWTPEKLSEQLVFMNKSNRRFVYSNYEKMTYDGTRNGRIISVKESSSYEDVLTSNSIPCLTALLEMELVRNVRFKCIPIEDCAFWLDVLRLNNVVAYNTNKVHGIYRESKNSRSGNKLEMVMARWCLLRKVEHIGFIRSIFLMIAFLIKGYLKYIK